MNIKEVVVVEGRNDSAAVRRSVCAQTIITHGFGINDETWALIEKAYIEKGIIIFTDPDFSGEEIRRKLADRFPAAKHAHLLKHDAAKGRDIGVENAGPGAIIHAIEKARAINEEATFTFTYEDIFEFGLTGNKNAAALRAAVGKYLGIGYSNANSFLNKLNNYGVTREALNEAIFACGDSGSSGKA